MQTTPAWVAIIPYDCPMYLRCHFSRWLGMDSSSLPPFHTVWMFTNLGNEITSCKYQWNVNVHIECVCHFLLHSVKFLPIHFVVVFYVCILKFCYSKVCFQTPSRFSLWPNSGIRTTLKPWKSRFLDKMTLFSITMYLYITIRISSQP